MNVLIRTPSAHSHGADPNRRAGADTGASPNAVLPVALNHGSPPATGTGTGTEPTPLPFNPAVRVQFSRSRAHGFVWSVPFGRQKRGGGCRGLVMTDGYGGDESESVGNIGLYFFISHPRKQTCVKTRYIWMSVDDTYLHAYV